MLNQARTAEDATDSHDIWGFDGSYLELRPDLGVVMQGRP
jgi:hypothetical protein